MERRLQKLQTRATVLRDVAVAGVAPDLTQVIACEARIAELRDEHDSLTKEFKNATTPAMKKLSRDYAKLSPLVLDALAKANQACFDARFSIEAASRGESVPVADGGTSSQISLIDRGVKVSQKQTQLQIELQKEKDAYDFEIEKELKQIETHAQSVRSLTENVALMVAHQADDTTQLAKYSSQSRNDVVAGLSELADAKKKEAGKHTTRSTTVSAVIGGAVGLVGGPLGVALGAAAGAAVGAAIGSSIAGLSRRSIDREVRAFKDKFRVDIRPDGTCITYAEVYENERWSLSLKIWSSESLLPTDFRNRWTLDELGTPIGVSDPSPLSPDQPPKSPVEKSSARPHGAAFQQGSSLNELPPLPPTQSTFEEEGVMDATRGQQQSAPSNSTFSGSWRWAQNSKWMPAMSDKAADANGWQYAFSFGEGAIWYPAPNRTSFVRRRRWIREQMLDPQKAHYPERIAIIAMERKRVEAEENTSRKYGIPEIANTESLDRATRDLGQSTQASASVLEELKRQGDHISEAAYDVAIAEDAAVHAQRVSRAVTMSGVFRNAFSNAPDATERAAYRRQMNEFSSEHQASTIIANSQQRRQDEEKVGWDHPVDVLGRLAEDQLTMSRVIHAEVASQNQQLDMLSEAHSRGERRIIRAKDMI